MLGMRISGNDPNFYPSELCPGSAMLEVRIGEPGNEEWVSAGLSTNFPFSKILKVPQAFGFYEAQFKAPVTPARDITGFRFVGESCFHPSFRVSAGDMYLQATSSLYFPCPAINSTLDGVIHECGEVPAGSTCAARCLDPT